MEEAKGLASNLGDLKEINEQQSQFNNATEENVHRLSEISESLQSTAQSLDNVKVEFDYTDLEREVNRMESNFVKGINESLDNSIKITPFWQKSIFALLFLLAISLIGNFYQFKTEKEIQDNFVKEQGYKQINQEDKILFDDMLNWFENNPKTKKIFIDWRNAKTEKKTK